jgi:hypothetical protein
MITKGTPKEKKNRKKVTFLGERTGSEALFCFEGKGSSGEERSKKRVRCQTRKCPFWPRLFVKSLMFVDEKV